MDTRREHDFLGDKDIPAAAYWGVHTARAVDNFPISGQTVACMPELVRALAYVKKAAAKANVQLIAEIKQFTSLPVLRKDFIVDLYQLYQSRAARADAAGRAGFHRGDPDLLRRRA